MTDRAPYDALMHEVCVGLGWCGSTVNGQPRHVNDYLPDSGPVTADQFVDWLLEAEGFAPTDHPERVKRWRKQLLPVFVKHMGGEVVDASKLKWHGIDT